MLRGLAVQKSPERVELVERLPRTASGKVHRFHLRETILRRMTDEARPR